METLALSRWTLNQIVLYLILDVSRKKSSTTYVDTDSDDSDMEVDIAEVNLLNAVSDYQ